MANKKMDSVLIKNIDDRKKNLSKNKEQYKKASSTTIVGSVYNVPDNERNPIMYNLHSDILRYTHDDISDFSKNLHEQYGISIDDLKYYSLSNVKPSYKINEYDGFDNYINYVWDVYGKEESYAGHLSGLLGVRELAENLAYDVFPDAKGKTAQDVINEIMQYSDVKYAMQGDRVGIVRDINVAMAVNGQVTTNINNYSGKETKMGLISNRMYGTTLLNAASFNSMRRTKYITPELSALYGNNLNNVYNLSSLFRINDDSGMIAEPDSNQYAASEIPDGSIEQYLSNVNPYFSTLDSKKAYDNQNIYFGVSKNNDEYNDYTIPESDNTLKPLDRSILAYKHEDSFGVYSEGDFPNTGKQTFDVVESIDGVTSNVLTNLKDGSLLKKTNDFLNKRKIKTMISRFHDSENKEKSLTQSSVYDKFGISHGRNLLTAEAFLGGEDKSVNGYTNPYCRVWTNHQQYSKMKHLIRPFISDENFMTIKDLQKNWYSFRNEKGAERLSDNSVLNKNGMVNITPTKGSDRVDVKQCMFSIENLAWKDVLHTSKVDNDNTLSDEQIGPNGGRIMWFPPYDINFQETASAKWSENEFIGRGEPVFTYVNSTRSGTLDFTLLVDHPSILNYWLMDKYSANESDEQTLLRFFAGCEAIEPSEELLKNIENDFYLNYGSKDPKQVAEEKDIVFYTFFPNNYSGASVGDDAEKPLAVLFGGKGNDGENIKVGDDIFYLGYEMGVNPMSIDNFDIIKTTYNHGDFSLENIYDLSSAEKLFENINDIKESSITITKEDIQLQDVSGNTYNYIDYENIKKALTDNQNNEHDANDRITELEGEIIDLEAENTKLENEIKVLEEKIVGTEGTMTYFDLSKQLSQLKENKEIVETSLANKNLEIVNLNSLKDINYSDKEKIDKIIQNIESKFSGITNNVEKTNPLFVYKEQEYSNASECYAAYACDNLKSYKIDGKPYSILDEKMTVACKNNDVLWVKEIYLNNKDIHFYEVENKRKFNKSNLPLAKLNDGSVYFVKYKGEIYEFATSDKAKEFIAKHDVLPVMTKSEFKTGGTLCAKCSDDGSFMFYNIIECSTNEEGLQKVEKYLNDESENETSVIVKKYFKNHKFGALSSMDKNDYGVIQLFITGKLQDNGEGYNTVQDFIARHNVQINGNTGKTFHYISEYDTEAGKVTATWDWSKNKWGYPIDKGKETENISNENLYDKKSFGLNSTYEMVKKELGDNSVTFSFGEVYAALHGDKEKEFVLSCEKGILKTVLNYQGVELETKVNEASERIEYLKQVFNPSETSSSFKITNAETWGTASSDGTQSKNEELASNRNETLKKFLKSIPSMAKIEVSTRKNEANGAIVDISETAPKDVNDIISKKAKYTKVYITVGDKDKEPEEISKDGGENNTTNTNVKLRYAKRYDNERLFFELLKENDSVAYQRLVDKVKYFSPAYHSITPEGFNSRLTFLHQCTRQGPTSTSSDDVNGTTAANLAFGRAPFCILRLGDFLNTKIVIQSINITYPESMWDLNPEGIGAQFMMAKVSMQIQILGGSDIAAPIKRLQNAVSFNYYANTSIYDNRSDIANYEGNDIVVSKQWKPQTIYDKQN